MEIGRGSGGNEGPYMDVQASAGVRCLSGSFPLKPAYRHDVAIDIPTFERMNRETS
jgi:hypothetical protein